jgi:hypothetical protein
VLRHRGSDTITAQVVPPGPASSLYTIEPCRLIVGVNGYYGVPDVVPEDQDY